MIKVFTLHLIGWVLNRCLRKIGNLLADTRHYENSTKKNRARCQYTLPGCTIKDLRFWMTHVRPRKMSKYYCRRNILCCWIATLIHKIFLLLENLKNLQMTGDFSFCLLSQMYPSETQILIWLKLFSCFLKTKTRAAETRLSHTHTH